MTLEQSSGYNRWIINIHRVGNDNASLPWDHDFSCRFLYSCFLSGRPEFLFLSTDSLFPTVSSAFPQPFYDFAVSLVSVLMLPVSSPWPLSAQCPSHLWLSFCLLLYLPSSCPGRRVRLSSVSSGMCVLLLQRTAFCLSWYFIPSWKMRKPALVDRCHMEVCHGAPWIPSYDFHSLLHCTKLGYRLYFFLLSKTKLGRVSG